MSGAVGKVMPEISLNEIKAISKSNFLLGILNAFIILPLFIYLAAFVLYHEDKGQLHLSEYGLKFLLEPTVFALCLLVVMNAIVDFWVYQNPQKAVFKMGFMLLNLFYILWMITRGFIDGSVESYVISGVLLFILMYKLFRYREYYYIARHLF